MQKQINKQKQHVVVQHPWFDPKIIPGLIATVRSVRSFTCFQIPSYLQKKHAGEWTIYSYSSPRCLLGWK